MSFFTAAILAASGIGLLAGSAWAAMLFPVALGMLIYTVIVSVGYFAEKRLGNRWDVRGDSRALDGESCAVSFLSESNVPARCDFQNQLIPQPVSGSNLCLI